MVGRSDGPSRFHVRTSVAARSHDRQTRLREFLNDRLGRRARVGGRDDWPADDEVACARPHRFGRSHRPHLIVLFAARRRASDSGRDDHEICRRTPSGSPPFPGGCDDTVQPRGLRQPRQRNDLIEQRALDARLGAAPPRPCS